MDSLSYFSSLGQQKRSDNTFRYSSHAVFCMLYFKKKVTIQAPPG